jgi:ribonuclease J
MTKLTFFGGVNEIGGNKILLEDNGTKIFLDFGMSFNQFGKYFSEFLQPRKCNGIGDFLEFNLLPDLKGVYRRDYLKHMGRKIEDTDFQGILLSHAHADHAAFIHHVRCDVPIYCSEPTHAILKALNDTSRTGFSDLTDITTCFETYITKRGNVSKKNKRNCPDIVRKRPFEIFKYKKKFKIDDVEVIPYNVDHSLPGATGYVIHTSSGTIVYTGDFRFNGRRPEKTEEFMEECSKAKPDLLITEGTRIQEESSMKESDVEDEVSVMSSKSKGLSVCNWPIRDTDRMMSFFNVAKDLDKKLAVSLKQAYLIELLKDCKDAIVPDIDDENLELYAPRKTWGLIGSDWEDRLIKQDYDTWEREYLDDSICCHDIKNNQDEYMIFMTNFDLKELINIRPVKNSIFIKSVCEPFDLEMELDWKRVKNWIDHFGMKLRRTHVSGHASGPQLKEFVKTIEPKTIVPIHTEHPEIFDKWWGKVKLLKCIGSTIDM